MEVAGWQVSTSSGQSALLVQGVAQEWLLPLVLVRHCEPCPLQPTVGEQGWPFVGSSQVLETGLQTSPSCVQGLGIWVMLHGVPTPGALPPPLLLLPPPKMLPELAEGVPKHFPTAASHTELGGQVPPSKQKPSCTVPELPWICPLDPDQK